MESGGEPWVGNVDALLVGTLFRGGGPGGGEKSVSVAAGGWLFGEPKEEVVLAVFVVVFGRGLSSAANISSQSLSLKFVDVGAGWLVGAVGCEVLTLDEKP